MSTPRGSRIAITDEDVELAMVALRECADQNGLTPVRAGRSNTLTPQAVLRAELEVSQRRSDSIMYKLKKLGKVIPTEHSTKVIIADMVRPLDKEGATPQPDVVTIERIRRALLTLRDENSSLKAEINSLQSENQTLTQRVAELEGRMMNLEGAGDLDGLLSEIEQSQAA